MYEEHSYVSFIGELQDAMRTFKEKLGAQQEEPIIECLECISIAEDLLKEVYLAYFSAVEAPEEDRAATVLFELAQHKLVTPYLVEQYMEAQRAVDLFRKSDSMRELALYQEYLAKIPLIYATLEAVVPVIERLPQGLDVQHEEREHDYDHQ